MDEPQAQDIVELQVERKLTAQIQPEHHSHLVRFVSSIVQIVVVKHDAFTVLPVIDLTLLDQRLIFPGVVFGIAIDPEP